MKEQPYVEEFNQKDIDRTIVLILKCAIEEELVTPAQLFALGMSQSRDRDWEDYSPLIAYIENHNLKLYPLTERFVRQWNDEQREAAADAACEVYE